MRTTTRWAFLAGCLGLVGCVLSLNPLYRDDKDLTFDPDLVGAWQTDNEETWEFQKAGELDYKLGYTDKDGKQGEFSAHMVKLGEKRYLDLLLTGDPIKDNTADFYRWHVVRAHGIVRIDRTKEGFALTCADLDKWRQWLDEHPDAIAHVIAGESNSKDGQLVLTAKTEDLRKFISGPMDKPEFWGKATELLRKHGPATQPAATQPTATPGRR